MQSSLLVQAEKNDVNDDSDAGWKLIYVQHKHRNVQNVRNSETRSFNGLNTLTALTAASSFSFAFSAFSCAALRK